MYFDSKELDDKDGFVNDFNHTNFICGTYPQVDNILTLDEEYEQPLLKQIKLGELITANFVIHFARKSFPVLMGEKDCRFLLTNSSKITPS